MIYTCQICNKSVFFWQLETDTFKFRNDVMSYKGHWRCVIKFIRMVKEQDRVMENDTEADFWRLSHDSAYYNREKKYQNDWRWFKVLCVGSSTAFVGSIVYFSVGYFI